MNQSLLKTLIHYNPETGIFTNLRLNRPVGCIRTLKSNYKRLELRIKGKNYKAHRLAFLYMTGEIPDIIDHIDNNALNNAWSNLRIANNTQNNQNSKIKNTNKSGFKGVCFRANNKTNPWFASITVNYKSVSLGYYKTKEEAALSYNRAATKYFGLFANLNKV